MSRGLYIRLDQLDDASVQILPGALPPLREAPSRPLASIRQNVESLHEAGDAPATAPEAMAEAFVKGGLTRKLKRAQGPKSGVAPISILFVDLSHAREIAQETEFDPTAFVRVLEENLPDDLGGYDALAVTTSAVADGEGRLLFVATQDEDDEAAILLRELYQ